MCTSFSQFQDTTNMLQFHHLLEIPHTNLVGVTPYNAQYAEYIALLTQKSPDYLFHLRGLQKPIIMQTNAKIAIPSTWVVKNNSRIIGMDLKNYTSPGAGVNRVISSADRKIYNDCLDRFFFFNAQHGGNNAHWLDFRIEMDVAVTPEETHKVWLKFADKFGPFHPPLWVRANFHTGYFDAEGQELYETGQQVAFYASEMLDRYKAPNISAYTAEVAAVRASNELTTLMKSVGLPTQW
jgi:hypothetical protein